MILAHAEKSFDKLNISVICEKTVNICQGRAATVSTFSQHSTWSS